jgi:hypothetical protein
VKTYEPPRVTTTYHHKWLCKEIAGRSENATWRSEVELVHLTQYLNEWLERGVSPKK